MGLFITFEGVEGSGKTTQIRRLARYLRKRGIPCAVTREPGGTPIGEKIRKILLDPDNRALTPLSELFLYEAARAQHVSEVIKPGLKKDKVVLCDRFSDASVAYQGNGRGIDPKRIGLMNQVASGRIRPDLTFLFDCPPDMGLKRALQRNRVLKQEKEGRFEKEKIQFHNRVRKGYLAIARREPGRVKMIDTRLAEDQVFEKIRQVIDKEIGVKGSRGQGSKEKASVQNEKCKMQISK